MKSYELAIALRYLQGRRHGLFAFVTTLIAIGGVMLGVAALIVTLAVMNGFRADIQAKTLGIQPHVVVQGMEKNSPLQVSALLDKVKGVGGVQAAAPYILGQTILRSSRNTQGVVLRGIDPDLEFAVTGAGKSLISGDWADLAGEKNRPGIVLGKELSKNMGVSLGDELLLFSPTEGAALGAMGSVPKVQKCVVAGVFQSGMYEFDSNMAFLSLKTAQDFFQIPYATGLGVKTNDLDEADSISARIGAVIGMEYWSRSWLSMNRNLFEALKLEKIVMWIILTMIILVASFTIISNLILMSIEKSRDIGILKALGASRTSIRKIFLYAGTTLGAAGTLLGTALGAFITWGLGKYQWIKLPQDVYYIDTLPVKLLGSDVAAVMIAAFLITVLAAVYPASQAARVNPVDAIRYG